LRVQSSKLIVPGQNIAFCPINEAFTSGLGVPEAFCSLFWIKQESKLHCITMSLFCYDRVIVCFQKISIPPPRRVIGNSEGERGLKGQNF